MGIENQRSAEEIPREGEVWSYTEDISRVGKSFKVLPILNHYTTVTITIGNRGDPGDILEYLRLARYESWSYM